MKKLLLLVALVATATMGLSAQSSKGQKSVVANIGFQTDFDRFMLGAQGRYVISDNIRLAPDLMLFVPNHKTTGLDINLNAHYVFDIDTKLSLYPLTGLAIQNNRVTGLYKANGKKTSKGFTDFGFNLGGGASYNLNAENFINIEAKYIFGDADCFVLGVGYGFRF